MKSLRILNAPALLIVLGGTIGAVMVQTSLPTFTRAFKIFKWIVKPPKVESETLVYNIVN